MSDEAGLPLTPSAAKEKSALRRPREMNDQPRLPLTPSQTVGPYFTLGLMPPEHAGRGFGPRISNEIRGEGEPITVHGKVFDGAGKPVDDAMLEIIQADGNGRLDTQGFIGFARTGTGAEADSSYTFKTVKPGPLGRGEAPHICMIVLMRGMLLHACTRIYFADEAANPHDPVFRRLPEDRRETLLARRTEAAGGAGYKFDIYMQGERETVFFRLPEAT